MTIPITIESTIHFKQSNRGARKCIHEGEAPAPTPRPVGRIPRVARFMALAIRFDELLRDGQVADYAELARLTHVSRIQNIGYELGENSRTAEWYRANHRTPWVAKNKFRVVYAVPTLNKIES